MLALHQNRSGHVPQKRSENGKIGTIEIYFQNNA